jgi:hypothetical protein
MERSKSAVRSSVRSDDACECASGGSAASGGRCDSRSGELTTNRRTASESAVPDIGEGQCSTDFNGIGLS